MTSNVLKFADDTELYSDVTTSGGKGAEKDLHKFTEWYNRWLVRFNVEK